MYASQGKKTVHTFPCVCQGNHIKLFVSLSRNINGEVFSGNEANRLWIFTGVCVLKDTTIKMNWPLFDSHRQLPLEATLGLDGLLIYWAYQGRQENRYTVGCGSEKRASQKIYNLVASWFISKPQEIHLRYKHFKETIA